jgi:hypothetical protein
VGRKSELAVWAGVIKGLEYCDQSDSPLVALGDFLGRLRRRGWHPTDVRVVEQSVLELMGWREEQKMAEREGATAARQGNTISRAFGAWPAPVLANSIPTAVW